MSKEALLAYDQKIHDQQAPPEMSELDTEIDELALEGNETLDDFGEFDGGGNSEPAGDAQHPDDTF